MKSNIKNYIKKLDEIIQKKEYDSILLEDILTNIHFFQHERMIHLIVTFFVGIGCILFLFGFLYFENIGLLLLFLLSLSLFIPYIFHYYTLENGVQKLQDYYFIIKNKN